MSSGRERDISRGRFFKLLQRGRELGTKRRKRKRKIKGRIPERFLEGDSRVRRGEELRVFSLERLLVRGKIACGLQGFLRGEAAGERVQVSFDFWRPLEIRE